MWIRVDHHCILNDVFRATALRRPSYFDMYDIVYYLRIEFLVIYMDLSRDGTNVHRVIITILPHSPGDSSEIALSQRIAPKFLIDSFRLRLFFGLLTMWHPAVVASVTVTEVTLSWHEGLAITTRYCTTNGLKQNK